MFSTQIMDGTNGVTADKTIESKIDINHINSMCSFETDSYQICLELGERNYSLMKNRMKDTAANVSSNMPDYHYPYECDILADNEKSCLNFWTRVSRNFQAKKLFEDRSGTPDQNARKVIIDDLTATKKLPYIGKHSSQAYMI